MAKWAEIRAKKKSNEIDVNKMPSKEGRDNKDVVVRGNGYSNGNKVRYPSKKRSRRVWKNFYKLFPWLAVKDGWDGKKSKRME